MNSTLLHDLLRETSEAAGSAAESVTDHARLAICPNSDSNCLLQNPAECEEELCNERFTIIVFPFIALFIGVLATPISKAVKVPYTLFLLIVGILVGLLGCGVDLGMLSTSLRQWVHLNPPTTFFFVFLAPLIFEAAFNTRWHIFKRLLLPILTAAFIIVSLQVGLIATFQRKVIQTEGWSWWAALMFGAMLSATDPISVTATLKSLGASEFLNTLIEGESLVNDGSAFVLFEEFFENTKDEHAKSVGEIIGAVFRLSIGGMVMGIAFGLAALIVLGLVYDEFEVETSLTVIVAFLGFWTAQSPSRLSGVICNVASGLLLSAFGRHLITPAVREPLSEFWELLGWIANTIVFVHAGVLLSAFTWSCSGDPHSYADYLYIPAYYLFLQVIRIGLILLFKPIMSFGNKWYGWREAFVVGFSGLRGAVSLILALEVAGSEDIDDAVRSRVVLWTTGIVALSLLVNGFLIKPVISGFKLDKASKTKENFLQRARAIMVQRTLMILDTVCIETGFKSARWSYVVKNVLPHEWLDDSEHATGYRQAVEQLMDNAPASMRKSLEIVANERRGKLNSQANHRLSLDIMSMQGTPTMTPRLSTFEFPGSGGLNAARKSLPLYGDGTAAEVAEGVGGPPKLLPMSLGLPAYPVGHDMSHRRSIDADMVRYGSVDVAHRRSIEADMVRYGSVDGQERLTGHLNAAAIHDEVAELHNRMVTGEEYVFSDQDREVRRRLLTAILSHVRAITNASLVEYSVLIRLEQDVQMALDANEEHREYDLFSFLQSGGNRKNPLNRLYVKALEGKHLRGEAAITTAIVVFGILMNILKEEMLQDSPIVQLQAERLYEAAAALLNRLEVLNPEAFEWVQSQFAVYMTGHKQDVVLDDMLASGVVDEQEFHIVHEELIEVRRRHVRARQSIFQRSLLPPHPKPREMIRNHPLFVSLPPAMISQVVDRHGQLVHLKGGQVLQAEKGSLVLVLKGAIRPLDDSVLPPNVATSIRRANEEVDTAISHRSPASPGREDHGETNEITSSSADTSEGTHRGALGMTPLASGATMHWCFPSHNSFCGPTVTLHAHGDGGAEKCSIAHERALDTQFCCCEIAGSATVFTLPVLQVKQLARESMAFRLEITRSLAREIVLESVADQRPYVLSHFMDSIANGLDVTTVVGRAFKVLERLPYMEVVALHAGEQSSMCLQGPGVLLNGTVRVSIVDTSGLVGAINLLHEELTGPALLPAGGLILQEVHQAENPQKLSSEFENVAEESALASGAATEAAAAATEILQTAESANTRASVLAHVLIEVEELDDPEKVALLRLQRWRNPSSTVDMNGRFGMYRHVELAPLKEVKIE